MSTRPLIALLVCTLACLCAARAAEKVNDEAPTKMVVTVTGQIVEPGRQEVEVGLGLLDIALAAGGFTEMASGKVQVIRNNKPLGAYKVVHDPANKTLTFTPLGDSPKSPQIQSGDIIVVHEGAFPLSDWRKWTRDHAE